MLTGDQPGMYAVNRFLEIFLCVSIFIYFYIFFCVSNQAAANLRLRPRGHWDRPNILHTKPYAEILYNARRKTEICIIAILQVPSKHFNANHF
jgi:hypothetical protein